VTIVGEVTMRLAVAKEVGADESRVALVPESVKKLTAAGLEVAIERDAGARAHITDQAFIDAGANIAPDLEGLLATSDMLLKVGVPGMGDGQGRDEVHLMRPGSMLLTSLMPQRNPLVVRTLADRHITAISTDAMPRITRAQGMDTLSSMANISGYLGALLTATMLGKYCPMLMTAAGTILPSRMFVIGAGVAGLQAIATVRRLGANVFATDVRPEVKEQIESVGAKYVGVDLKKSAVAGGGYAKELSEDDKKRQRELLAEQCALADGVITTALIGGVFAPKLISADIVKRMKGGAVIMDLAAEGGGNCELSQPGSTVVANDVTIAAPLNLPSSMPMHASMLWSRNLTNFLMAFWKDRSFNLDLNDDILKGAVITHNGEILHAKTREALAASAASPALR
jgi:H+-translocating NAD(P) transhydrogenase subunit alpha